MLSSAALDSPHHESSMACASDSRKAALQIGLRQHRRRLVWWHAQQVLRTLHILHHLESKRFHVPAACSTHYSKKRALPSQAADRLWAGGCDAGHPGARPPRVSRACAVLLVHFCGACLADISAANTHNYTMSTMSTMCADPACSLPECGLNEAP